MSRRNVSEDEVQLVINHGQKAHRAGAIVYFLGRRQLGSLEPHYAHLEGTTVLWCPKRALVTTVYRNRRRGLKDHRRKPKFHRKKW
jgi:hypothetical protein